MSQNTHDSGGDHLHLKILGCEVKAGGKLAIQAAFVIAICVIVFATTEGRQLMSNLLLRLVG